MSAVCVTGAAGFLGRRVVQRLSEEGELVLAIDRRAHDGPLPDGVRFEVADVGDERLCAWMTEERARSVVHLAAAVEANGAVEAEVAAADSLIRACRAAEVSHLVYTSSGAAYGYEPDNPEWLSEDDPLRARDSIPYAAAKRAVEETLAAGEIPHRLVLRPGTVLGRGAHTPVSALFEGRRVVGLRGVATSFVLVWDEDVADCIVRGVLEGREGVYNVAGDGSLTLREIAALAGKPYAALPARLLASALSTASALGLGSHGGDAVPFLRYRPVLRNDRLKRDFPGLPRLTSREVFQRWWESVR